MAKRPSISSPTGTRRGIQSVETGLRVLAALAAGNGAQALTAIGGRAGISPSQTHRYLQSLVAAGMATQDAASRYDLGPAAIRVGIAALARLDVFARAEAALASFVAETGRTALLSVWGEAGAVVVRWFPGNPPVHTAITIGSVMPMLRSETGQMFLALLPDGETKAQLARERAQDHAASRIDLSAIRARIRRTMLAGSGDFAMPGLRAVAAPMFNMQGRVTLVATAIATEAFSLEEDEAVAARLLAACRTATDAAGGVWPSGTAPG